VEGLGHEQLIADPWIRRQFSQGFCVLQIGAFPCST